MPSSKTTVHLREECKKAGIKGFRDMSNKDMIEKLGCLGKNVELPERKIPKRRPKTKSKVKQADAKRGQAESKQKEEQKMDLQKIRRAYKMIEEKKKTIERKAECKHKFEWMRPSHKRICLKCGEESANKIFVSDKEDLN